MDLEYVSGRLEYSPVLEALSLSEKFPVLKFPPVLETLSLSEKFLC